MDRLRWPESTYLALENMGWIPEPIMKADPTLHFCCEWDYLLIDSSMWEHECCTCQR
jgi:hypothetical protein